MEGDFNDLISIGFDKNGEADFRINMGLAGIERPKMDELCRLIPWAIKEAMTIWLEHGPPSRDGSLKCASPAAEVINHAE